MRHVRQKRRILTAYASPRPREWQLFYRKRFREALMIELLCKRFDHDRGIWKQIDENRQLLQFLQENIPDFLDKNPWVEVWIKDTDIFLNSLLGLLELKKPARFCDFPRKWPGKDYPCDPVQKIIEKIKCEASVKNCQYLPEQEESQQNQLGT